MKPVASAARGISALLFLFLVGALSYQMVSDSTFFTSYIPSLVFGHNFHTVVDGRFYRSASMSGEELLKKVGENHIRTVIDLRPSARDDDKPASLERSLLESNGIKYFDVPLIGSRMPERSELLELLSTYDQAEEPILVHCSSGTHRSGVATAIWLLDKTTAPINVALEQLSPKFGYLWPERELKSWLTGTPTIDHLMWDYLAQNQSAPTSFRDWVENRRS